MQCLLKGSEKYCETGRGICCQSCMEYGTCEKACLNDPRHCGYAGEKPASSVHPIPKPGEGGGTHAR